MIKDLSTQRERYAESLAEDLDRVVGRLSRVPAVRKVILFGSYATGRRDLFTDLDILVIMDSSQDFVTRNVELARGIEAKVALDLLAYTPQEIERNRHRPFLRRVFETGRVLYEREPIE